LADYITRTSTGFLGNLGGAIKGVLVGIVLFFASFAVLWWNEGRTDMSQVAVLAQPAAADRVDTAMDGKFVWATSTLQSDAQLEDPDYLYPVQALALQRDSEMFAWVEKCKSRTEKKVGGGSETITECNYVKEWASRPPDSSEFQDPAARTEKKNPPMAVQSVSWTAERAAVGAYAFDPRTASLPSAEPLHLKPEMLRVAMLSPEETPVKKTVGVQPRLEGDYLYMGRGTPSSPWVGDVRVRFKALKPGAQVTLFGKQNGPALEPYVHTSGDRLFRVFPGTRDEAVARMASEHKTTTWLLRLAGFMMMWIGMGMFFGPLHAVMDIIPFVGTAGRAVMGMVLFPLALLLAGTTIVVAKIAHSPVALIVVVALILGGVVVYGRSRAKAAATA
jgi:hypothetical protein